MGNLQLLGRQSPKCFKSCSSCTKILSEATLCLWFLKHIEQNATITSVHLSWLHIFLQCSHFPTVYVHASLRNSSHQKPHRPQLAGDRTLCCLAPCTVISKGCCRAFPQSILSSEIDSLSTIHACVVVLQFDSFRGLWRHVLKYPTLALSK